MPMEQDAEDLRVDVLDGAQDQETTTVGGDRILRRDIVEPERSLEERLGRSGGECCSDRNRNRHHLAIEIDIEDLLAVLAPQGLEPAGGRDLPPL